MLGYSIINFLDENYEGLFFCTAGAILNEIVPLISFSPRSLKAKVYIIN